MAVSNKQKALLENLAKAFSELSYEFSLCDGDDPLLDEIIFDYPFDASFDEQSLMVSGWVDGLISESE